MRNFISEELREVQKTPLCVYALSPSFSVRSYSHSKPTSSWRRDAAHIPRTNRRFKQSLSRNSNSTSTLVTDIQQKYRKILSIEEILDTIQQVWTEKKEERRTIYKMEKKDSPQVNLIPSPVFLRRRLSAPETIMRKHSLAQQRSDSWDNVNSRVPDSRIHSFPSGINSTSDPFLNKNKRDNGSMRKSTLLRRFFGSIKQFPEQNSRNFGSSEFQFYRNRKYLRNSSSLHCSQELVKSQSKPSLNNATKRSPEKLILDEKEKNKSFEKKTNSVHASSSSSFNFPLLNSNEYSQTTSTTHSTLETENFTSFATNCALENSDSAYTKSTVSNTSTSTSANSNASNSVYLFPLPKYITQKDDDEISRKFKVEEHLPLNTDNKQEQYISGVLGTSTQTSDTTNLNVISNVQLSQSTLEAIFTHVLKDVQNVRPTNESATNTPAYYSVPLKREIVCPSPKTIHVKEFPVFTVNPEKNLFPSKSKEKDKYLLTNIDLGCVYRDYSDDKVNSSIPRFSAVPKSSSMDVNVSSEDNFSDKDSIISNADSLEEQKQSKIDCQENEYNTEDFSPLLPDNSLNLQNKSASFFVPIGSIKDLKDVKSVADHLPKRVKDKLSKRQLRRIQKQKQSKRYYTSSKSDSNYVSASENGKTIFYTERHKSVNDNLCSNVTSNSDVNFVRKRRKSELPSIEFLRRNRNERMFTNKSKRPKNARKEVDYKMFHVTPDSDNSDLNFNKKSEVENLKKQIEILQIVECVGNPCSDSQHSRQTKSRIPVIVPTKIPKTLHEHFPKIDERPLFLSISGEKNQDSKVDQLIANILIDALNQNDSNDLVQQPLIPKVVKATYKLETLPSSLISSKSNSEKYKQTFEAIPEEKNSPASSREESLDNVNLNKNLNAPSFDKSSEKSATYNESNNNENYKGKAAIAGVKDDNFTSVPKGWITFYMLHKCPESPDRFSDEGSRSGKRKLKKSKVDSREQQLRNHKKVNEETVPNNKTILGNQLMSQESKNSDYCFQRKTNDLNNLKMDSNEESEISIDHTKNVLNNKEDGWSLTLKSSGSCKFPENLQMRLKILNNSCQNCKHTSISTRKSSLDHSELENESNIRFPPLTEKERNFSQDSNDVHSPNEQISKIRLPKIVDRSMSQVNLKTKKFSIEPRQTKTSTYRKALQKKSRTSKVLQQVNTRYYDD